MKKYTLLGGVALAAVTLAVPAQAQSLEAELGTGIIDLLGQYEDGSFANIAVNTAAIDASVNATAEQVAYGGSLSLDVSASEASEAASNAAAENATSASSSSSEDFLGNTSSAAEQSSSSAASNAASEASSSSFAASLDITVEPENITASLGDVSTSAVGAVNAGDINIVTPETAEFGLEGSATLSSSSAAATTTSAAATAFYGNLELDVDYAYQGIPDVTAMNIAYNEATINGSVNLTGLGADSISTSALGAANLGTITVGGPAPASE